MGIENVKKGQKSMDGSIVMIPGGLRGKDDDDARRETEVPRKRSD